jgi:signal peptidase I
MLWDLVKVVVAVLVCVITIRTFVAEAYVVQGASMEPTVHNRERLLITKFAPRFEDLTRGDIVIFEHPREPGKRLIKRIVALPGESVEIRLGQVLIEGEVLNEPYLSPEFGTHMNSHIVAEGCYFVLGDNRSVSNDSRRLGDVHRSRIIGKAIFRFYPGLRFY